MQRSTWESQRTCPIFRVYRQISGLLDPWEFLQNTNYKSDWQKKSREPTWSSLGVFLASGMHQQIPLPPLGTVPQVSTGVLVRLRYVAAVPKYSSSYPRLVGQHPCLSFCSSSSISLYEKDLIGWESQAVQGSVLILWVTLIIRSWLREREATEGEFNQGGPWNQTQ